MSHENNDLDYDEFGLPKCTKCDTRMILPVSPKWEHHSSVQAECPSCGVVLVKSEVIAGSTLVHQPDEMVIDVNETGGVIDPSTLRKKRWEPWNISTKEKPGTGLTPNDIRKMNSLPTVPGVADKKPFSTRSEKELDEILTGLDLLSEYSDVFPYLEPLFNDVKAALANLLREVRA